MIYIDPREGSINLKPLIPNELRGECPNIPADVEFIGSGPGDDGNDAPIIIGVEYKTLSDCLTSMTDGRLTGTQLPRMLTAYDRRYLLIEGKWRVGSDGVLETWQFNRITHKYEWAGARGRKGEGWMAREFWGRLESVTEFFDCRVMMSYNIEESAQRVISLYHYWQKPYHEHSSYKQWDQSRDGGKNVNPASVLLPTSSLSLTQRWARELYNVGQDKSEYIARQFRTPFELAMADAADWAKVTWEGKYRSKPGYRSMHFSKKSIEVILRQIREGIDPSSNGK